MRLPPSIRQLWLLLRETMSFRRLVFNRFVLVVLLVAVLTAGAAGYASVNDDGTVRGVVVDGDGDPVAGANVSLRSQTFEGVPDVKRTTTDADGEFTFDSYRANGEVALEFRLSAEKSGVGESGTCRRHVYYPDQSVRVTLSLNDDPCRSSV